MRDHPAGWFERLTNSLLPGTVVGLFILLLIIPAPVPKAMIPDIALMLVFTAAVFRARAFPVWLSFTLGLLADVLGGTPPGMQAAVFTGVHAFATSQQRHLRQTAFLWGGFVLVAAGAALFRWLLLSAYHQAWLEPWPMLTNMGLTVLVFPLVSAPLCWLLGGERDVHRRA